MVKPFLEHKTYKKVKFVYSDQPQSMKTMEALFDKKKLESAFGGDSTDGFNFEAYAKLMIDAEKHKSDGKSSANASPSDQTSITSESQQSDLLSDNGSEVSDEDDPLPYNNEASSEFENLDQMGSLYIGCKNENDDSQEAKNWADEGFLR